MSEEINDWEHLLHFVKESGLDVSDVRIAVKHWHIKAYERACKRLYDNDGHCKRCLKARGRKR